MYYIGIDPGAGTKSPTGIAHFHSDTFHIEAVELWPRERKASMTNRLICLSEQFNGILEEVGEPHYLVCEYFYMRAKGGESLQRLIGAYYAQLTYGTPVIEVQNVKVKQFLGGSGKADKLELANGTAEWFKEKNKMSYAHVKQLIKEESWDALDAVAIAVCGYLLTEG